MARVEPARTVAGRRPARRRRRTARWWLGRVGAYAVLTILAAFAVAPFVWAVSTSLKAEGDLFSTPPSLWPSDPQWSHYAEVFDDIPFVRLLVNTVLYTAIVTAGQVAFCTIAGYAFARMRFRGRDGIFLAYLATLMVPITVTLIPQFMLMRWLGWVNTPMALTVPFLLGSAFGTYLMRQSFLVLPADLEEAAILDGASQWKVFSRVYVPLVRPAMTVLAVFTVVFVWNDFLWPLIVIQGDEYGTLTLGLVHLQGQYYTNWPVLMAAATMTAAPLIALYLIAQRAFVRGISMTGAGGQ